MNRVDPTMFREPPTWTQIVGGALVIGGVAWSEWRLLRVTR